MSTVLTMPARTPKPPYYAVIFTFVRTEEEQGYEEMANKMLRLAVSQPGFLGIESVRSEVGITVSYWESLDAIQDWKHHAEHTLGRETGRSTWYKAFKTRICKVEIEYGFEREE